MLKVINEPGKTGKGRRKGVYKNTALEDMPTTERIHLRSDGWSSSSNKKSNNTALKKWLYAQVGRPWNDVYSEACKVLKHKPDKWGNDVVEQLFWFVERNVLIVDGKPFAKGRWNQELRELGRGKFDELYIHPISAILLKHKAAPQPKVTEPETFRLIVKHDKRPVNMPMPIGYFEHALTWYDAFEKIDGIWYFTIGWYQTPFYRYRHLNPVASFKRQLNKKELKQNNLKNG